MRWMKFAIMASALCVAVEVKAGPFGRRTVTTTQSQVCTSDGCGTTTASERSRTVVRGRTATAQGVAEIQAEQGRVGHHGGNAAYEGVGCGSTPDQALRSCCNNGRPVVDQGVARGRDGRWYACRRYAR